MSITRELIIRRRFFFYFVGAARSVSLPACVLAGSSYGRLVADIADRTERQTDGLPCYAMLCHAVLLSPGCLLLHDTKFSPPLVKKGSP